MFLKSIVSISPDKMPKKMIRKEETKPDGKKPLFITFKAQPRVKLRHASCWADFVYH